MPIFSACWLSSLSMGYAGLHVLNNMVWMYFNKLRSRIWYIIEYLLKDWVDIMVNVRVWMLYGVYNCRYVFCGSKKIGRYLWRNVSLWYVWLERLGQRVISRCFVLDTNFGEGDWVQWNRLLICNSSFGELIRNIHGGIANIFFFIVTIVWGFRESLIWNTSPRKFALMNMSIDDLLKWEAACFFFYYVKMTYFFFWMRKSEVHLYCSNNQSSEGLVE